MDTLIGIVGVLVFVAAVYVAVQKHVAKNAKTSVPSTPHPHDGNKPPSDVEQVTD